MDAFGTSISIVILILLGFVFGNLHVVPPAALFRGWEVCVVFSVRAGVAQLAGWVI